MKKLHKITNILLGLAMLILASACSSPMDEITSMVMSRNLSPTDVSLLLIDRTNVQLTWTATEADSYTIEVYADDNLEFDASHLESVYEGILAHEIPFTIEGLQGETVYSFRIKAVTEDNPSRDSKWSTAKTTTGTEQIMYKPSADDIQAKSVILSWKAGQKATQIILTPADESLSPVTYNVTAENIEAGKATIEGLTPETEYTAVLKNGEKTRGTQTFTTAIELADDDILVEADDLMATVIKNAPDGYRLIVMPGKYYLNEDGTKTAKILIEKNLRIKGLRPNDMPVIYGAFGIKNGASLEIEQCVIDGTGTDTDADKTQAFDFVEEGKCDHLYISNSEIRTFVKGLVYLSLATEVNEITINNTIIHDIITDGGDFIDNRQGYVKNINLTNSTIYNSCAKRDFVRLDGAGQGNVFAGKGNVINVKIDHCTFYKVGDGAQNRQMFYNRFADNKVTFTNNIVSGWNNKRGFTNDKTTDTSATLSGNYYHNTLNLMSLADGNTQTVRWFDTEGTALTDDPFEEASSANFTITDPVLKANAPGDPRWIE